MKQEDYTLARNQLVIKANELIQKSRFDMGLQQQKILLYLISKIKPADEDFHLYEFSIVEFCKVCGIDAGEGKNYTDLKKAIKDIADKSLWITREDGKEVLLRWIGNAYIENRSGMIGIKIHEDMKPYLLQLKKNFTCYELVYSLHFKSKYTIRLYELIRSIHYKDLESYKKVFEIDDLKKMLNGTNYKNYGEFNRRVLAPSVSEINEYSDQEVSYTEIRKGRKVIAVEFEIETKPMEERISIRARIDREMGYDGQISFWE